MLKDLRWPWIRTLLQRCKRKSSIVRAAIMARKQFLILDASLKKELFENTGGLVKPWCQPQSVDNRRVFHLYPFCFPVPRLNGILNSDYSRHLSFPAEPGHLCYVGKRFGQDGRHIIYDLYRSTAAHRRLRPIIWLEWRLELISPTRMATLHSSVNYYIVEAFPDAIELSPTGLLSVLVRTIFGGIFPKRLWFISRFRRDLSTTNPERTSLEPWPWPESIYAAESTMPYEREHAYGHTGGHWNSRRAIHKMQDVVSILLADWPVEFRHVAKSLM